MQKSTIKCPICNSVNTKLTELTTTQDNRQMGKYWVYSCSNCDNGFTHPQVGGSKTLLVPDKPLNTYPLIYRYLLEFFTNQRIKIIKTSLTKSVSFVLDVGGGSCNFANALSGHGVKVKVLEPNKLNHQYANADVDFVAGVLDRKTTNNLSNIYPKGFDAITLWHVLEHCPDPVEVLRLAHDLLNKKGKIVIAVPNINSFQARLAGRRWAYLDVPHHLFHFSPKGLHKILSDNHFTQKKHYRYSLEYDLFGWQQTLLNMFTDSHNYFYQSTKKGISLRLRYPIWTKFLTRIQFLLLPLSLGLSIVSALLNRSSCLIYVYQKS